MSGFNNPVVGGEGGALVRARIKSPNYVAGSTGWSINQDGSAEFIGLIIRTGASGKYIVIGAVGNANVIQFFSGLAGETAPGYLLVQTSGGPPADEGYVELAAPALGGAVPKLTLTTTPTATNSNALLDSPGSVSITGGTAVEITAALINLATSSGDITLDHGGSGRVVIEGTPPTIATASADLDLIPGSGTVSLPTQGHRIKRGGIARPTLVNSWVNFGGSFEDAGYIELPDHTGMLTGVIKDGTTTSGTTLFTLPSQMRPANDHVFIAPSNGGLKSQIVVQAGGPVKIQSPDAGVTWVSLDGCQWPISGF